MQIPRASTHHDRVPLISFWVAAQECNTHAFLDFHVLAVAKPIAEFDLMALEVVYIFKLCRSVREDRREPEITVVRVGRDNSERDDEQLRRVSVVDHGSPSGYCISHRLTKDRVAISEAARISRAGVVDVVEVTGTVGREVDCADSKPDHPQKRG
jgi:hypothetical protein